MTSYLSEEELGKKLILKGENLFPAERFVMSAPVPGVSA